VKAVYLGLGSNLGDRERTILKALVELDQLEATQVVRVSSLYDTEPVGEVDQPRFLNAVALVETGFGPRQLLWNLKLVERRLGRTRARRWGPRAIDIDILVYDDLVVDEPDLEIPHRELRHRAFVLVPLAELASELVLPTTGESVSDLLRALGPKGSVRRLGRLSY
jgi:2-amino-4-hydroxy-6-hydroxymethyldihydropteridine diphosphokinase